MRSLLRAEGHPPPGVNAPSMKILIHRLELAKNDGRASSASVKEPKKVKEVSFYPSLDMESKSRETQYAVSTVHSKNTPRRDGKRQCKSTERLGDFHSGQKTIATSQDRVDIIKDSDLILGDDIDVLEDDDDDADEIDEYYQRKEQRAMSLASMVRGKNSMVPREEVIEDAEDNGRVTEVASYSSETKEPIEEFKAPSMQLSTQELLLNVPPRPTTRRAMAARQ